MTSRTSVLDLLRAFAARIYTTGLTREEGQGLVEYALILAFIAIVAIVALRFLGGRVNDALSTVGSSLQT